MDTDALIKLWKGPANATALVDWSPPAFLKGYLPLKEGQPIRVVEPFGNWWWSMCEAGNFGYVKHSLLAPHWVEPQPWFVNLWLPGDLTFLPQCSRTGGLPKAVFCPGGCRCNLRNSFDNNCQPGGSSVGRRRGDDQVGEDVDRPEYGWSKGPHPLRLSRQ